MNLSTISPHLLSSFKSEAELVSLINKVSENFTAKREQISDYLEDEKMVAAYTAFYLTTNYPKFAHVMKHLKELGDDFKDCEWVDIGCGPGTFLFAIKDFYGGALKQNLWGIETSPLMRKQAKKIQENLYPHSKIDIVQSTAEIPKKEKKRIALFSHSLNEMGNQKALDYLTRLEADKVLFVEPGTKAFFHQYLELRTILIEQGFNCLYPCPSNGVCPMQGQDDWCHQYLKVKHDLDVSRLTQLSHKNRKWLPMTIGLYTLADEKHWQESDARVVRTYPSTKFSFEWDACVLDNNQNTLRHFQVMKRKMSKAKIKEFDDFLAGQRIKFELDKDLGDNKLRVKLLETNADE